MQKSGSCWRKGIGWREAEREAGAIEWKRKVFELIYCYDDKEMAMACSVWEGEKDGEKGEMRIELGFGFWGIKLKSSKLLLNQMGEKI